MPMHLRATAALPLLVAALSVTPQPRARGSELPPGVVEITGALRPLALPPPTLELGQLTSDTEIVFFKEATGVALTRAIPVDITEPGEYCPETLPKESCTEDYLGVGWLGPGPVVDSYYFHFDNASYAFNLDDYVGCIGQIGTEGSITFARPILAIVLRSWRLNQSNPQLSHPAVDYCEHTMSHFPGVNITDGCGSDRFSLSQDRRTLTVRNHTDIHHDNYRVLVEGE